MEYVIIVAAGTGSRFGADVPKQFTKLDGRPVLMHTIERVRRAMPDARLVLVLSAEMTDFWQELCREHGNFPSPAIVHGGATRYHSVANALASLPPEASGATVYIHDGARPLLDAEVVQRLRLALETAQAAIPVLPVSDSLRQCAPDGGSHIVDRSAFVAVQTPQAFHLEPLLKAYAAGFDPRFTDDASVVETVLNLPVALVPGSHATIKITNPQDIKVVEALGF